jgi:Tol biopolymer transport system component
MSPDQTIAHYRITAKLGEGGMGEVWRATDTKLGRDVAIKVIPEFFAQDTDRLARFTREAQVLASLNHPHIAAIYGVEDRALVMELVEGPTLTERIAKGPIPLDEVLPIARQVAEALEYAHEKGIIHRDLKPANVKLTADNQAKVLDFGLSKVLHDTPSSVGDMANSPTETIGSTRAGMILGTVAYMSPEQARGRRVDRRTDIWAFGCVLYELLAEKSAFGGETVSDTIAAILSREPDWGKLPLATPSRLRDLLRRCLQHDPARRLQHIGDARIEIEEILAAPAAPVSVAPVHIPTKRREMIAWAIATAALVVAASSAVGHFRRPPAEAAAVVRFSIPPPEKTTFVTTALHSVSPDGRLLAFRATTPEGFRVYLQPLDSFAARALPGTEGAVYTFWSADSRFLAFGQQGKLRKIDVTGGPVQTIADGLGVGGGTWNRDGVIVAPRSFDSVLYRVPAAGGTPTALTELDLARGETGHQHPHFLPDGRHFLYLALNSQPENTAVYAASLDAPKAQKRILNVASQAMYSAPGYLLFVREGTLLAQRFDAGRLEVSGEPVPVAEQVVSATLVGAKVFSVSANGVLAFRTGGAGASRLAWFDRAGKPIGPLGPPGVYATPKLSPDQKRLAVERVDPQTATPDLWLFDLVRTSSSRFTFDRESEAFPVWSPDGTRVAFASSREGPLNIYQKSSGGGAEEPLLKAGENNYPTDWSPDGRFLLYATMKGDLWVLPLFGDRKPFPFSQTPFSKNWARFSPDGRWVAYQSNASGQNEVYVQPFREGTGAGSAATFQVSTNGGTDPQWRRDGKELFYMAPDRTLMAVDVKLGSTFEAGSPKPLFQTQAVVTPLVFTVSTPSSYTVSADGRRFLVNTLAEETAPTPIRVVLNWPAALRK